MTEAVAQARLIALRHYRTLWFGQEWAAIAGAWQTEYNSVAAGAFTPVLITNNSGDGWSTSAQKNFEQSARLAALQQFRADKDAEYAAEVFAPSTTADGPTVMLPVFAQSAFPH